MEQDIEQQQVGCKFDRDMEVGLQEPPGRSREAGRECTRRRERKSPVATGANCDKPGGGEGPGRDLGNHLKESGFAGSPENLGGF